MKNHAQGLSVILALVLVGTVMTTPGWAQGPGEVTVPFTAVSTVYAEDFAEGDGGFTTGGTAGTWEFGVPSSPPEILEGQTPNVWGTNLDGDHGSSDCGWIDSPEIDLSGYPAVDADATLARLSFTHWIDARMSSFSDNAYSGGIVMASSNGVDFEPIEPIGGYDSSGVFFGQRNCLGVDSDQGIYSVYTSDDTAADAWRDAEFDVSEFVGGQLTVRWFFGAGGTSITERGWYVDDVRVEVGAGASADVPTPGPEDLPWPEDVVVPFTPVTNLYSEDFAEGDGGFAASGDGLWEFGVPTSPPNIQEGQTPNVWGTKLDSDYGRRDCGYVDSPPIDLSGYPGTNASTLARLSFDHWIHAEMSSFSGRAYDGGLVLVSSDGVDFTPIDPIGGYPSEGSLSSLRSCHGYDSDQKVYSTFSSPDPDPDAWETAEFDVTEYLGGNLTVRWVFGSDFSVHNRGWYVDAISVDLGVGATVDSPDRPGALDPNELLPDQVNAPFTPVTNAYGEDFAEDQGGFSASGDGLWEFGVPTSPPNIQEGQTPNVWGTNIDGDYPAYACGYVESPAIDLSGYPLAADGTTLARLSFQHWIHAQMSTFSGTAYDGGLVMVSADGENFSVIDPVGGYTSSGMFSNLRSCTGQGSDQGVYTSPSFPSPDPDAWETAEFDVTEFLGGDLTVRWVFGSSCCTHRPGWYIDDVNVDIGVGASVDVPEAPTVPEDPTDLAPDPSELFPEPDPETGWAIGGENPSWEYGEVTDTDSDVDDFRGEVGYMTNLDGTHNAPECSSIQSPVMLGSDFALDPELRFEHAYRIPGAFVDVAWGGGLVMVSGDGGMTWDYLDLPEYDRPLDYSGGYPECFTSHGAPLDGNVFSGANTDLHDVTVDLSSYVGSPAVIVKFVFGASSTFAYEGWFINEVELGGQMILE